jgi:hypothetical protein
MRVFSKKQRSIFYLGQKASHKKTTELPNFCFSTISPYFKKPTTTILFKQIFGFDDFNYSVVELLKMIQINFNKKKIEKNCFCWVFFIFLKFAVKNT